ncbi:winged helix-turn-helix transcriptional regulator [Amycolatopsis pithecellobii]|uniref:Transcriptional regulator n=1 Tax=Amycolatopsis pithecellobii TaxID=664692 RepID=A0A6N7YR30_9PSEU|nr:helix-turn-helix domain-containing protein [Amycolatopsis pithecellobii]MTD55475.1 transcriptional regulator [Amycolatopsis pithecellobii]
MSSSSAARRDAELENGGLDACEALSEPLSRVMVLLGRRWAGVVLSTLLHGPAYFNELKRRIPAISDRVLNDRLIEFAELGLVTRTIVDQGRVRVQYALTDHGAALRPAITELTRWAEEHLSPDE